jgi:hypothetical protein
MYKKIFEKIKLPIAIFDKDGNYINKNEEFIKTFSNHNYENIFMNLCKNKNGIELFSKILFSFEENEHIHKIESLLQFYKDYYQIVECICEFIYIEEDKIFVMMITK